MLMVAITTMKMKTRYSDEELAQINTPDGDDDDDDDELYKTVQSQRNP